MTNAISPLRRLWQPRMPLFWLVIVLNLMSSAMTSALMVMQPTGAMRGLLTLFAVQHSVMARPAFKRWWTQFIPASAERSTYVLFSSLALIALFYFWQPLGGVIWEIENRSGRLLLNAGFGFGWALVLYSTFLINHFDLFGLRQVWLQFIGRPYTHLPFRTPTDRDRRSALTASAASAPAFSASLQIFMLAIAVSGVLLDGFQMQMSPQIAARNEFHAHTATGKLNALMIPTMPIGCHCSYMRWPGRSLCMVRP